MLLAATTSSCSNSDQIDSGVSVRYTRGTKTNTHKQSALSILNNYKNWLNQFQNRQSFKATSGDLTAFMWVGNMVQNSGFANNIISSFVDEINTSGMPAEIYYEFMHTNSFQSFGVILTTRGLASAKKAVKMWSTGSSYNDYEGSKSTSALPICYLSYDSRKPEANDNEAGQCMYKTLASGESPSGNAGEYLKVFNPSLDFSSLSPGQPYCFSEDSSPDFRPSANTNGTCYTHYVQKDETCSVYTAKYSPLSISDIEKYNKNTFGWLRCSDLQIGQAIYLSNGNAPRPVAKPKAECGPLAPGDKYNSECPLNACCSQFGFCGLTSEFCDKKDSRTGAPGTAGCDSNCGYGTLPTKKATSFKRSIYWLDSVEGMDMNPTDIDPKYDIVHYSFAAINNDFSISVGSGFSDFMNINAKKVVAFGGWDFSTSSSTYNIFRSGVSDSNIDKFANSIIDFVNSNNLDGVNFDWEYPGAPDIPGIPAGDPKDGQRYSNLMNKVKQGLGDKLVSIAIPASYWYLKQFPLKDIDKHYDYFVLMSYDFVGQWDYDKPHTGIGCHCDRSTTELAIKMIVKSGIDTTKVYSGLANYGRGFTLSNQGCSNYMCEFTNSPPPAGDITKTP